MPKLSDTQLVILSAACARGDRRVLPLPKSLKGGAAQKVIDALIAKGLVAETEALKGEPVWREDNDSRKLTLVATAAADEVLEGGAGEGTSIVQKTRTKAKTFQPRVPKPAEAAPAAVKTRPGTKQARLIALLKRPTGASIAEIAEALDWQPHTVRGALAGALKKKLGLEIASETHETRGRVYRITD